MKRVFGQGDTDLWHSQEFKPVTLYILLLELAASAHLCSDTYWTPTEQRTARSAARHRVVMYGFLPGIRYNTLSWTAGMIAEVLEAL